MSAPRFAGNLLAMPHFADEARFRLDEAAGSAEAIAQAINGAARRIRAGEAPKLVAFDLVTEHPAVQVLAALAEVTEADRAYVYSALEIAESVRAVVGPLVVAIQNVAPVQSGLRATVPALSEVRSTRPQYIVEVDVGRLLEEIGLAVIEDWIDLATGDWGDFPYQAPLVIPNIPDIVGSGPHEGDPIYEGGVSLIRFAVYRAVIELVRHNGHHLAYLTEALDPGERFSAVTEIRARVLLNRSLLDSPDQAPFIEGLRSSLARWWRERGLGRAEAATIAARLGAFFTAELLREWCHLPGSFAELASYLDEPDTPSAARARFWQAHRARLMRLPHEAVFADTFSLAQVWQPLRVFWVDRGATPGDCGSAEPDADPRGRGSIRYVRRIERATTTIGRWLAGDDTDDTLRVVSGGPGAGKSSLAKIIAAGRAALGERVLLIELFHFDLADSLAAAINRFGREQGLRHDVLAEATEEPLLLIFDGLDELSIRGSVGREAVTSLIDDVRDLLRDHNRGRVHVRALLLGREVVVEGVSSRFRQTGQVLHVLPYVVPFDQHDRYHDPDGLLAEDQRDGWWRAYGVCKGRDYDGFPLTDSKAAALTVEPLLNYLVAIALDGGADLGGASLTDVYGALVRQVFERVHAGDAARLPGTERVELWAFEEFLRAVAVVAWHGEGRVATLTDIIERCPPVVLDQMQALERGAESAVSRLIAAFYFRQPRDAAAGDRAFEFTHQSFAEYLIAREIVSFLEILRDEAETNRRRGRRGWTPEAQLAEWARLFGPAAIEPNTFDFVLDGLRGLGEDAVRPILATLNDLLGRVLRHDFPLSALGTEGYAGGVLARSRNAGEALLALASGCAEVVDGRVSFEMPTADAFGTWLRRLQPQRASTKNSLALTRLARLELAGVDLAFADLGWSDLSGTNLFDAHLDGANLRGARLAGADLRGAFLAEVELSHANLAGANLAGANLAGANLYRASLAGANLRGAHLSGANLSMAYVNAATRWPDGFDPDKADLIFI